MVADLRRAVKNEAPHSRGIPRVNGIEAQEFFRDYYAANRPVIITDLMRDWPALRRWSPQYFMDRVGDVEIEAVIGRGADPLCDQNFRSLIKKMTMREYARAVESAGESNDIYMISNTRNMNLPGFAPLREDIVLRSDLFEPSRWHNRLSFWFGPKGTVTPLHHDQNNNMFCQVVGRKRVRLISPDDTRLLRHISGGFYSDLSLDDPDGERFPWYSSVAVEETVLEPGDALFIPVGWWHDVRSLAVSVNLSIINFVVPNEFSPWYKPGLT